MFTLSKLGKSQCALKSLSKYVIRRTFLSQAYYCNEIWEDRLRSPILQKVNLDILYHELDQRFQKTKRMSPVDVDIFVNSVKDEHFVEETMDVLHKLRLTEDTGNTLESTGHAAIRILLNNNKTTELLLALDDRLNYGLFLDSYTANILMDTYWKNKNFTAGSIVAAQMMLQEDLSHPLNISFALLHCYNYLLNPQEWPQAPLPEEPEEEVKVRVKYIKNPFNDDHFDLREPTKIIGKTLVAATKGKNDPLHNSLKTIGLVLYGKEEHISKNKLIKEVVDVLPNEIALKKDLLEGDLISEDVQKLLEKQVIEAANQSSERDIADQCELYKKWEAERRECLEAQRKRLRTAERLAEIDKIKETLKQKEQKLWFFENEEKIELTIEEIAASLPEKKAEIHKEEAEYIPPEVTSQPK